MMDRGAQSAAVLEITSGWIASGRARRVEITMRGERFLVRFHDGSRIEYESTGGDVTDALAQVAQAILADGEPA